MGQYKERVTIYEVAKAAGVSLATVSRVINNHPNVTERTRKQVEDAVNRLGYKPSALAQGLATNRSTNIGIVLPSINYAYITNMLSGMADIANIYGFSSTLFVTSHSREESKIVFGKLITSHVDGAVIFNDQLEDDDISAMQKYSLPLVVIGREAVGKNCASITLDYESSIIDLLSNHFDSGNKHKIKFLDVEQNGLIITNLINSVKDFCSKKKQTVEVISADDSYQRIYAQMMEYFKTDKSGGYFICPRDSHAAAVLNAASDSGLKIPEQVEIVSVIGTKYSYITRPQISSLEIDMFEIGSIAMRILTKILKGEELSTNSYHKKSTYINRGSTID